MEVWKILSLHLAQRRGLAKPYGLYRSGVGIYPVRFEAFHSARTWLFYSDPAPGSALNSPCGKAFNKPTHGENE